jgi:hypothetical protein
MHACCWLLLDARQPSYCCISVVNNHTQTVAHNNCVASATAVAVDHQDAWVARHACITLRHAAPHLVPTPLPSSAPSTTAAAAASSSSSGTSSDPVSPELHQAVLAAVVRLLVGPPAASIAPNWHSAAEAAVTALYVLSPRPQEIMAAVLEEMFRRCRPAGGEGLDTRVLVCSSPPHCLHRACEQLVLWPFS